MDPLSCWNTSERHSGPPNQDCCGQTLPVGNASPCSLSYYKKIIHPAAHLSTLHRRNTEQTQSITIYHYDHFIIRPYMYCPRGVIVRKHNMVCSVCPAQAWIQTIVAGVQWVRQVTCLSTPRANCATHPMPTISTITAFNIPHLKICYLIHSLL